MMNSTISDCDLAEELKRYFGYNTFRPLQKEIIQAVLKREDVCAILPTGAGKSLCYQLPALLMPGTAIVVSPLISLMQDQVVSLFKNGIQAAFINSSLPSHEIRSVLQHIEDYKLLYVAPERLVDPDFIERLKKVPLSFFVIDEAHCISQWGHSFRVEYRNLSMIKQTFSGIPVIAVTATATPDVEKDIQNQLAMKNPVLIKGSFDRPNLTIRAISKNQPEKQLLEYLADKQNQSGIIYSATRKGVESAFNLLQNAGYSVGKYHAGLSEEERSSSQHSFLYDQTTLMVATVAFGMGVHKPDIRFIVHMDMPRTIEQYYQEIGRAGRDGLSADCLMLYGMQDLIIYKSFLEQVEDLAIRQQMKIKIEKMFNLCRSLKCRRLEILNYFGEHCSNEKCIACDNCLDDAPQMEGTIIAQKILSCVFRLKQNVGIKMTTDVLRGSQNQALLKRNYNQLPTYGLLKEMSEPEVRFYIDSLLHLELLTLTEGEYPVLKWTAQSKNVIDGKESVYFKKRDFKTSKPLPKTKTKTDLSPHQEPHFQALRQLRTEIARQENVPPYVVFNDRALLEMATFLPQNQVEFEKINGVGPIKWLKYGEKFLNLIRSFETKRLPPKNPSREETLNLYHQGRNIEQIMEDRQLARSTIISHIAEAIELGADLDLTPIISEDRQEAIRQAILEVGNEKLKPIKEKLPPDFTYDEIKLVSRIL